MSAPETEAGRRLLDAMHRIYHLAGHESDIAAIEAEAIATERARIVAAVEAISGRWVGSRGYPGDHHGIEYVDVSAVLAIIEPPE